MVKITIYFGFKCFDIPTLISKIQYSYITRWIAGRLKEKKNSSRAIVYKNEHVYKKYETIRTKLVYCQQYYCNILLNLKERCNFDFIISK